MENTENRILQEKGIVIRETHKKPLMFSYMDILVFALLLASCSKNREIKVTTKSVTNITERSATSGGTVSGEGYTIEECGICYSTTSNPTINNSHTEDHYGSGSFNSTLSDLLKGRKYYVRAYANTSSGVRYGNEVSFSTSIDYTITVSASPIIGGTVSGGGTYKEGQSCNLTAIANNHYSFSNWTENGNIVSTNVNYTFTVNGDRTITANFSTAPTGAINGLFSISATKQVWFSKGNLQYKASTNTWRFAENQWDYCGGTSGTTPAGTVFGNVSEGCNDNPSSTNTKWIDLFSWGTSGWNNGNTYYRPWDAEWAWDAWYDELEISARLYGPPGPYNLTDSYINADWGHYNPISNGGNQKYIWRTLTMEEWFYVFSIRNTSSGIRYVKAVVNGINGVILLPDNWNNDYYTLSNTNDDKATFNSNIISATSWASSLEAHSAVFLPATGYRLNPATIYWPNYFGHYWSTTTDPDNTTFAYCVYFSDSYLGAFGQGYRAEGYSVRLVQNNN